jgi:hypothetical protein
MLKFHRLILMQAGDGEEGEGDVGLVVVLGLTLILTLYS